MTIEEANMSMSEKSSARPPRARAVGVRVLLADDDDAVRSLYATLLRDLDGVSSVVAVANGADAVRVARELPCHVAILDFNMLRLDGVDAAIGLRELRPSTRVALHSSDLDALRERAADLRVPLFDKLELERLIEWVERQADAWRAIAQVAGDAAVAPFARRLDFSCSLCGYGIVSSEPPERCPMCGSAAIWDAAPSRSAAVDYENRYQAFAG
jgi:CheY-like chemotaxis protein/predicted RNA-binding Zn-ribbon protein involved in translation (DUF1610 family)